MANHNADPTQARQARRQKRRSQPGTLEDARALLWKALERAAAILENEDDTLSLKAIHAVSQGTAAYARIIEVGELEARLSALEGASETTGLQLSKRGAA